MSRAAGVTRFPRSITLCAKPQHIRPRGPIQSLMDAAADAAPIVEVGSPDRFEVVTMVLAGESG